MARNRYERVQNEAVTNYNRICASGYTDTEAALLHGLDLGTNYKWDKHPLVRSHTTLAIYSWMIIVLTSEIICVYATGSKSN